MTRSVVERRWQHAGFECAVLLMDVGHRCGYVRLSPDHPWHGLGYSDRVPDPQPLPEDARVDDYGMASMLAALTGTVQDRVDRMELQVRVHGGLTYASKGLAGIEDEDGWWVGFDCAHADDLPEVWTLDAVVRETERMAEQLPQAVLHAEP